MRTSLFLILIALAAPMAFATEVLYVPGDYPTINSAIAAAVSEDIVMVSPGTYYENIDFLGKMIRVKGQLGPHRTFLDGSGLGSVASFVTNEGPQSRLSGFTIMNGSGTAGTAALASTVGGGVYCDGASPSLRDLIITGNTADKGAGIYSTGGDLTLEFVNIVDNTAASTGGGIFVFDGGALINDCLISGNVATSSDGGGIYASSASITMYRSMVVDNESGFWGGGMISFFGLVSEIRETVFASNVAQASGGGIAYIFGGNVDMLNVTIYGNSAVAGQGGGFFLNYTDPSEAGNALIWGNTAPLGASGSIENAELNLDYCAVEGGDTSFELLTGGVLNYGSSNIMDEPIFADTANHNYHLLVGSPGVDQGNIRPLGLTISDTDFEGNDRVNNVVDMGVDEQYSPYVYFSGDAVPGQFINIHFIGEPGAGPVYLWSSVGFLDTPIQLNDYGLWWLELPIVLTMPLPPLPATGYVSFPGKVPNNPGVPVGSQFPFQGFVQDTLTNPTFFYLE